MSKRIISAAVAAGCLLGGVVGGVASAELRTLETVGTLPLTRENRTVVPRDAAIEQALREGVTRIAQEFLADRPLDEPMTAGPGEEPGDPNATGEPGEDPADREAELERVLGKKMVAYTTRFRVIEDRGRRPALFSEDPDVTEEYVVIVEVQIDVERVRARLVEAGMLRAADGAVLANDILLEVDGLVRYAAYREFRDLLVEGVGAQLAVPVEMSSGRTVFDVSTEESAVEFLEALLTAAPTHLTIDPVHASGGRLRVAVDWQPPAGKPSKGSGPAAPGTGIPADL